MNFHASALHVASLWVTTPRGATALNRAGLHANFKLKKNGEAVGLFGFEGTLIDAVTFGQQTNDVSQGRYPDGYGPIYFLPTPTPRAANRLPEPPVPPHLDGMAVVVGGQFSFSFTLPSPTTYRVEFKNDLSAALWTPLGADQLGSVTVIITDNLVTNTQRFYRVVLNP